MKQIPSPSSMHEQGTQGQCPGTTLRDRMVREVGGGSRMGDTRTLRADSCQSTAKTTTIE